MTRIKYLLIPCLLLILFNGKSQSEDITVQLPDQLKISNNSLFDPEENLIYSIISNTYENGELMIWDLWNGIPILSIPIDEFHLDYDQGVAIENYTDSLVFYTLYYSNEYHRYHYNKKTKMVKYTGLIARETTELHQILTFSKPNNRKDKKLGYADVTGINLSDTFLLQNGNNAYDRLKFHYYLEVQNANYFNRKKDNSEDEWERFDKVTFLTVHSNNYDFQRKEIAALPFNTIAGAMSEDHSKLALLEADYKTIHLFHLDTSYSLRPWTTCQVNLPDTNDFILSFANADKTLALTNKYAAEILDIASNKATILPYSFCNQEKQEIYLKKDTISLAYYYNDIHIRPLNDKMIEVVFFNFGGGWTYDKYVTSCIESGNSTISILVDIANLEVIDRLTSVSIQKTSLDELLLVISCGGDFFSLYDVARKQYIKQVNLDHKLKDFTIKLCENDNDLFSINLADHYWSYHDDLMTWFPMVSKQNSDLQYLTANLYNESSERKHKALINEAVYVDPGLTSHIYELQTPEGQKVKGGYSTGEYAGRNDKHPKLQRTNSFTYGSDDAYYYVYSPISYSEKDSLNKQFNTDAIVQVKKITDSMAVTHQNYPGFSSAEFTSQGDQLFMAGKNRAQIVDFETSTTISEHILEGTPLEAHISSTNNSIHYLTERGEIKSYQMDSKTNHTLGKIDSLEHYMTDYYWSPNKDFFMVRTFEKTTVYDLAHQKSMYDFPSAVYYENRGYNDSVPFYSYNEGITAVSNNGFPLFIGNDKYDDYNYIFKKTFITLHDQKEIFHMMFPGGNWLVYLPNGYYYGDPLAVEGISFKQGSAAFPYEQFDHFFNRPDKVMEAISYYFGEDNQETIELLHKAYLKRLSKLGIRASNELPKNIPTTTITNKKTMPRVANEVALELLLQSDKYKIQELLVEVNGVPVLKKQLSPAVKISTKETISLIPGFNLIKVYCRDTEGNNSLAAHITINGETNQALPNLYVITIGTSKYEQSEYNLTYASKDATDFANKMKQSKAYNEVYTKVLIDQEVNQSNLGHLKSFLASARIDDEVMIFVAGHGVLDEHLDYYIASHDMDFNHPNGKGIQYEALEALLSEIKPLKKVIFLDACHSGEIDKEEVTLLVAQNAESSDVQFRAVGNTVKSTSTAISTSELSKSLFADLRVGTGATVISAAGGMEFAMESNELQNGLFTYCMIHGINSMEADLNHDGEIWLKEIQQYVQEQVTLRSGGKQKPTSRIENSYLDYRIW